MLADEQQRYGQLDVDGLSNGDRRNRWVLNLAVWVGDQQVLDLLRHENCDKWLGATSRPHH